MGADIHGHIDYIDGDEVKNFAEFKLGRDYHLFGLLAGVRGWVKPLVEPRGLPEKNSYIVVAHTSKLVFKDSAIIYNDIFPEGEYVFNSYAEECVAAGVSKWVGTEKIFITDPELHSHSYLYVDEMKIILERYKALKVPGNSWMELDGIIEVMDRLNKNDPKKSRFVFWFSN